LNNFHTKNKNLKIKSKSITVKCKRIKLIITDVDGVLTDGGMYYSSRGEIMKKFNTKDGMAVEILKKIGIKTILMTKENSKIVIKRAEKIKVEKVYTGILNKEQKLEEICKKFNVKKQEIAYMGDDINDLNIMKQVELSVCPSDAEKEIIEMSDYVCTKEGGQGVFREFANLILKIRSGIKNKS